MDTLTHLAAGALTPMMFKSAPKTRMMILFGIIAGEFPDIDVIAGKSPEAILAFHRGATHALVAQPLFALVLALLFHRLIRKGDASGAWSFGKTWGVALLALLIHLFLDCMTTFGTQIFLPFSDFRVVLPAMYIIDLSLTLPLLAAMTCLITRLDRPKAVLPLTAPAKDKRVSIARGALAWLVAYPVLALCLNFHLASGLAREYAEGGNTRGITSVELSPEPFAPLNWKVVGIGPDKYFMGRLFLLSPKKAVEFTPYDRPANELWSDLQREVPLFRTFGQFAAYPFEMKTAKGDETVLTFADMRYESTMPGLMQTLGRSDGLFLMQARFEQGWFAAYRFLYRGRDAGDTPWQTVEGKDIELARRNTAPGGPRTKLAHISARTDPHEARLPNLAPEPARYQTMPHAG